MILVSSWNSYLQFHTHRLKDSKIKCWITGTFMYLPFMAAFPSLLTVSCVSLLTSVIRLHFPLLLSVGVTGWVCFTPDSQASSICTVMLLSLSSMMLVFGLSQRIKIKLPSCIPFKYLCHIMACHRRKLLCVKLKLTLSRLLILTKVNLSTSKIYFMQNTKQYFSMTSNQSTSIHYEMHFSVYRL